MSAQLDSATLAARLSANPHNLPNVADAPPLCPHDYWAARFEREGRNAGNGESCPYVVGTMAATRWQAGRSWQSERGCIPA